MKLLLSSLALFILAAEAIPSRSRVALIKDMRRGATSPFIFNGEEASVGEFPHQLSLTETSTHVCGAVLITAKAALTLASCVDPSQPGNYQIHAGQHTIGQAESVHDVESILHHDDFGVGAGSFPNDIAIVYFVSSVDEGSPNIGTIAVASPSEDIIGPGCVMSGWGEDENGQNPTNLMKAAIDVIDNTDCQTRIDACNCGADVIDSHICVYDGVAASCDGDGGGPLTCGDTVNGLAAWGITSGGDCLESYPSVFTRVSYFEDWIRANVPGLP